ncbi:MAG: hypothetical protein AAB738_01215 [Patescibacteria group bacterium]
MRLYLVLYFSGIALLATGMWFWISRVEETQHAEKIVAVVFGATGLSLMALAIYPFGSLFFLFSGVFLKLTFRFFF